MPAAWSDFYISPRENAVKDAWFFPISDIDWIKYPALNGVLAGRRLYGNSDFRMGRQSPSLGSYPGKGFISASWKSSLGRLFNHGAAIFRRGEKAGICAGRGRIYLGPYMGIRMVSHRYSDAKRISGKADCIRFEAKWGGYPVCK